MKRYVKKIVRILFVPLINVVAILLHNHYGILGNQLHWSDLNAKTIPVLLIILLVQICLFELWLGKIQAVHLREKQRIETIRKKEERLIEIERRVADNEKKLK